MAARFWVGGTGTWDASTTTNWSSTTGGAGGASVPGSSDAVTFDASSGGGTVTVNTTVTVQSITMGAFTGTLDFSVNNNNVTLTSTTGFSGTGSGVRSLKLGSGTFTMTATSGTLWNFATTTNLTFLCGTSTITFSGVAGTAPLAFSGGALTYGTVNFNANKGVSVSGANTFANLGVTGLNYIYWPFGATNTITNAFTIAGGASTPIGFGSSLTTTQATISVASGSPSLDYAHLRAMVFSGGATFTATNSFDGGWNSGITITGPSGGGTAGLPASRAYLGV